MSLSLQVDRTVDEILSWRLEWGEGGEGMWSFGLFLTIPVQVRRKSSKLNPTNLIYQGTDKKKEGKQNNPYIPLFTIINWRFLL